jgi:hypothetical protein
MANLPERRYTEREAALILRAAAELQDREGGLSDATGVSRGLSLAQLEQVAMEAGIAPAMVRRAAVRVDERASSPGGGFLGAPEEVVVERTVEGEVDAAHFERLLDTVRRATGKLGEPHIVGRLFAWKGHVGGLEAEVGMTPADGRTTVRVRVNLEVMAVAHFMLKGMLGGVGGGVVGAGTMTALVGGPVGVLTGVVVAGGGYLWARRGYRRAVASARGEAATVADAVAATCADAIAAAGAR